MYTHGAPGAGEVPTGAAVLPAAAGPCRPPKPHRDVAQDHQGCVLLLQLGSRMHLSLIFMRQCMRMPRCIATRLLTEPRHLTMTAYGACCGGRYALHMFEGVLHPVHLTPTTSPRASGRKRGAQQEHQQEQRAARNRVRGGRAGAGHRRRHGAAVRRGEVATPHRQWYC